ncbi:metallophosphoesterase [Actinoplanes sp. NPDC026670]|uniref:metallophosphoesterase n=1 Tax=Actinoplanes sp. NPDC026670 TaxID=3154700 RepID=UPI0033D9B44E
MNREIAVIGDIHGNIEALDGILAAIEGQWTDLVFLGDYINRGRKSAQVLQRLIELSANSKSVHCLAGNHEEEFLNLLETGNIMRFLRIGGAGTINSYLETPEGDLIERLRRAVPGTHLEFLRNLPKFYVSKGLIVTHKPPRHILEPNTYYVHGHVPQASLYPEFGKYSAAIDTGCGTLTGGRLTCLLWPSLRVMQVNSSGALL